MENEKGAAMNIEAPDELVYETIKFLKNVCDDVADELVEHWRAIIEEQP